MSRRCAFVFVLVFSFRQALCYSGDPFEVRTHNGPQTGFVPYQQFPTGRSPVQQMQRDEHQPIMYNGPAPPMAPHPSMRVENDGKNCTVSKLLSALNHFEDCRDESQEVSSKNEVPEAPRSAYDYAPQPYGYQPPPYGYQPNYGPSSYHESSVAPAVHHSNKKISLLKPDLGDLVKPVTTKVAGKVSGLIGLVLALLTGSAPNDLELKGFKDIIINGIVKPLLVAKGGIKSLVSKLTIPVISILLINLEVLITIWWLWEDCPEHNEHDKPPPYSYPSPPYVYNSYR